MPEHRIRVVVFRSGEWWIAQCLEYNLATQARRLEDVPAEVHRVLHLQITASRQRGVEPFAGFAPAPGRYWDMYEQAKARLEEVAAGGPGRHLLVQTEARLAA
jgi:hypothetical protein